ncbi:PepSY domain-containing protein [Metabacillus fastidiosus]|uniref:PepSY domain-containing protein n=1 Tax=Metabacillus fastidiosus TaxID=1458 RepID=A0ABU6NVU2_9BACI|nr:PepSY domain-containing protein [Metabacillus fastidiosus]MED4401241.1 PepSY domain-containing protein [Metabacillus fastidiosus]MED4453181.1 PepSY domain-containing protein [Metabacillus fastidiosus]MED4464168.1 PepSY domain-containing protein [Metabacillus fastidiosus]
MKCKDFMIGLGLGITIGYFLKDQLKTTYISSNKALNIVKKAFKERGTIDGSWIFTNVEQYEKNGISYDIYKTGISRTVDDSAEQYETIVDAKTGTILEVNKV